MFLEVVASFDIDVELSLVVVGVHKRFFPFQFAASVALVVLPQVLASVHCIFLQNFAFPGSNFHLNLMDKGHLKKSSCHLKCIYKLALEHFQGKQRKIKLGQVYE